VSLTVRPARLAGGRTTNRSRSALGLRDFGDAQHSNPTERCGRENWTRQL